MIASVVVLPADAAPIVKAVPYSVDQVGEMVCITISHESSAVSFQVPQAMVPAFHAQFTAEVAPFLDAELLRRLESEEQSATTRARANQRGA